MTTSVSVEWLRHPLAQALLRFNLLPARLMHPLRAPSPARPLKPLPALERQRSTALRLGLMLSLDDPALALAMLPTAHFQRLQHLLGAALNAAHIRRTIARIERVMLHEQIGIEAMTIAREPVAAALSGLPVAPDWDVSCARDICMAWGAAILAQAFETATPEVAARARLRLAPDVDALRAPLAAAGLEPARALRICLNLLQTLEPEWLSSFPTASATR